MKRQNVTIKLWILLYLLALGGFSSACQPVAAPTTPPAPPNSATPAEDTQPTAPTTQTPEPLRFNGERALADVSYQVELGPRTPGSQAHDQVVDWIVEQLQQTGWQVDLQETTYAGQPVRNIIARRSPAGEGFHPWIVLGAHYDSRFIASADPTPGNRQTPVPGANDGASGVAVLLELARTLPSDLQKQVWLVFFDSEDQGDIPNWDWIYGSRAFVDQMQGQPDAMVLFDMVGDKNLDLYYERNSNPELSREIWAQASELGHGQQFIPTPKYSVLDDHTPFLERGIRAVDLIDFDYPYWHTVEDTPDKLSADSLFAVGDTILHWLVSPE